MKILDESGLASLWDRILNKLNGKSDSNHNHDNKYLALSLKTNYDKAYTHSTSAHAPSNAEANVQADWNETNTSSDAYIKNKPAKIQADGGNADTVNGHTVESDVPPNAVFTDTWRPVQNNLNSSSTTDSLSAAQGKKLKEMIDRSSTTYIDFYSDGEGGYSTTASCQEAIAAHEAGQTLIAVLDGSTFFTLLAANSFEGVMFSTMLGRQLVVLSIYPDDSVTASQTTMLIEDNIVNSLNSQSTVEVLSAKQGYVLNQKIIDLEQSFNDFPEQMESAKEIYLVHLTYDSSKEKWTKDKTFAEIYTAYLNGKIIFIKSNDGLFYNLSYCDGSKVTFTTVQENNILAIFKITSTDVITAEAIALATNTALTSHINDTTKHITAEERTKWNNTYSKTEINNKFSTLETNIDWKEAVANFDAIATTYPQPQDGWTVNTKDNDYTYRYNGSSWVAISANSIPEASQTIAGKMSAADKVKLDGIATGANKTTVDGSLSSTSTNPVQNKVVNTALANKVDKVNGKGLSTNDLTATLKTNYDTAYTHSQAAHAPSNAQANQNAFSNFKIGETTIAADTTTDTLTLAGSNVTLTADKDNDKLTIGITKANVTSALGYTPPAKDTVYTHPTTAGNKHIPSGGSSGQILRWSSEGTAVWGADNNTTYSVVTTSANGLMSKDMLTKLNGIATGAEVNQNAFSNVIIGSTTIAADSKTDTLTLVAGTNVTLTADATNSKITITSKDTVYTHPTTTGNKHIPSGGSSGQILRWSADGTAAWGADNNTTYSVFKAASSSAAGDTGLVPAPAAGKQASFLRGDGTWVVPTNTTYSNFVKSGSGAKAGLVPAPSTTAGTTKYLREDGTWSVPPNTTYTLGSFGITASAAELNYCDGVTSNIQTQLDTKLQLTISETAPTGKANLLWIETTTHILRYWNGSAWTIVVGAWG